MRLIADLLSVEFYASQSMFADVASYNYIYLFVISENMSKGEQHLFPSIANK